MGLGDGLLQLDDEAPLALSGLHRISFRRTGDSEATTAFERHSAVVTLDFGGRRLRLTGSLHQGDGDNPFPKALSRLFLACADACPAPLRSEASFGRVGSAISGAGTIAVGLLVVLAGGTWTTWNVIFLVILLAVGTWALHRALSRHPKLDDLQDVAGLFGDLACGGKVSMADVPQRITVTWIAPGPPVREKGSAA